MSRTSKAIVSCLMVVMLVSSMVPLVALADDSDANAGSLAAAEFSASDIRETGEGDEAVVVEQSQPVSLYRMYNMNSGEHFYTTNLSERNSLRNAGWFIEGVGWTSQQKTDIPVFRLYNPNAGDHHYTTSAAERDNLVKVGWRYEGIGWYSSGEGGMPVYRQYNPNARSGSHNFTTSQAENNNLVRVGWRAEGIAWYAEGAGWSEAMPAGSYNATHLHALANAVGGSAGIAQGYQTSISQASINSINQRLSGAPQIAFVAVNARTGKCIAHNADMRFYGASTIKAPYIAALCKYSAPGVTGLRGVMYNAITYSSNEAFNQLCARYGRYFESRFGYESTIALNFKYTGCYVDLSPRELTNMWITIREYICSNSANAALFRGLFGNGGYFKEGWMYNGMLGGQVYHLAGVQGDVVYAIMTRYMYRDKRVWDLKDTIVRAIS